MSYANKRKQSWSDENEMRGEEKKSKTKINLDLDCINKIPVDLDLDLSVQEEQSTYYLSDDEFIWESQATWATCEKRNRHGEYLNPDQMKIKDLPNHFKKDKLFATIKLISKLAVRIETGYVSMERPTNYYLSTKRGQDIRTFGSGWINQADLNLYGTGYDCCVITAQHVVYNKEEMKKIKLHFEWNNKKVELKPTNIQGGKTETDRNLIFCKIMDDDYIAEEIIKACMDRNELMRGFHGLEKYPNIVVVCGYPHSGVDKKISLGEVKGDQIEDDDGHINYKHTALTCRGVSGGMTWIVGKFFYDKKGNKISHTAPHMCACSITPKTTSESGAVTVLLERK